MSAATVGQGLSGTCCGIKGSLWLLRWFFWQVLHLDIISSITPLILGQKTAPLARARHLSIPKWPPWMRWRISGRKLCIATYFISVVPEWPDFCGCFILDVRPPIHDNRLQLLKFWILLSHLSVSGAYGFWKVLRVQDMNFKLIRPMWCFDR